MQEKHMLEAYSEAFVSNERSRLCTSILEVSSTTWRDLKSIDLHMNLLAMGSDVFTLLPSSRIQPILSILKANGAPETRCMRLLRPHAGLSQALKLSFLSSPHANNAGGIGESKPSLWPRSRKPPNQCLYCLKFSQQVNGSAFC